MKKEEGHLVRRCVVCRRRHDKHDLIRLVVQEGRLLWDKEQRYAGRGAYLHREIGCISRSGQAGLWERALRTKGLNSRCLAETVKELLELVSSETGA